MERRAAKASLARGKPNPSLFIDLFAGCGGLSLGLVNAGWTGYFAIEKHPKAFRTLAKNLVANQINGGYQWPTWLPCEPHDIRDLRRIYRHRLEALRGQIKLVAGGPPCQGFSMAGLRREGDERNQLIDEYVEFVGLVKPDFLLLENVEGIALEFKKHVAGGASDEPRRRSGADRLTALLANAGYETYTQVLPSYRFGVPQRRPRFVLIGICRERLVRAGRIEHGYSPFKLLDSVRREFLVSKGLPLTGLVSPQQALSDLERRGPLIDCADSPGAKQVSYRGPRTRYQRLLHGALNGSAPNSMRLPNHRLETRLRYQDAISLATASGRRGVSLHPSEKEFLGITKHAIVVLDPSKPTHTITTLPDDIIHYKEPRILTVRENARLQSFPDWFEFLGTYSTGGERRRHDSPRYTQVGNAVPPFLAEALGMLLTRVDSELAECCSKTTTRLGPGAGAGELTRRGGQ